MIERLRATWRPIAALALAGVWLSPALRTPFRFDDTFNFEIRTGLFDAIGMSFPDYVWNGFTAGFEQGRVQPVGTALSLVPWGFSDAPTSYKLYLLALTLAVLALGYRIARRLGATRSLGALTVVLIAAFLQLRAYHDPLMGYVGVVQVGLLLFQASVLCWLRFDQQEARPRVWLWASVGLWLICLSLYEVNVALAPALIAVILARRGTLRPALPFLVPLAAVGLLILGVRLFDHTPGAYYNPGGGSSAFLRTWLVTIVGAVPGSYAIFDPQHLLGNPTSPEIVAAAWRAVVAAIVVVVLARRPAPAHGVRALVLLGAALWLLPGIPIAVSPKYQSELRWGMAYIPGFMQLVGFSTLAAAGLTWMVSATSRRSQTAGTVALVGAACISGVAAGSTGLSNARVVADEQPTRAVRALLGDALRAGVLEELPADATVVGFARDLRWYPFEFATTKVAFDAIVADRTGRRYDMRVDSALPVRPCVRPVRKWPRDACEALGPVGGWLSLRPQAGGGGIALLAVSPGGQVDDSAAPSRRFVVVDEGGVREGPPLLTGRLPGSNAPWSSIGTVRWTLVASEGGARRWRGELDRAAPAPMSSTVDPGGPVTFVVPTPAPARVRWLGTRVVLP